MAPILKKIAYKILHILTLGRGIRKKFEGNIVRMPTRYYRYYHDGYEKANFIFINDQVKPGMTVLDIGAHIGLMTVPFSKRTGPDGKVYAFEPTPATIKVLRETIRINKLNNVYVEPYALAEKKGTVTFYISDNAIDNSNSLVDNKRSDRKVSSIEVPVDTVDDLFRDKKMSWIGFIKIDAEGAELQILKGAANTIARHKPAIILSIHPYGIRNFGDSPEEIWDMLSRNNYHIKVDGKETGKKEFVERMDLFDVHLTQK